MQSYFRCVYLGNLYTEKSENPQRFSSCRLFICLYKFFANIKIVDLKSWEFLQ